MTALPLATDRRQMPGIVARCGTAGRLADGVRWVLLAAAAALCSGARRVRSQLAWGEWRGWYGWRRRVCPVLVLPPSVRPGPGAPRGTAGPPLRLPVRSGPGRRRGLRGISHLVRHGHCAEPRRLVAVPCTSWRARASGRRGAASQGRCR